MQGQVRITTQDQDRMINERQASLDQYESGSHSCSLKSQDHSHVRIARSTQDHSQSQPQDHTYCQDHWYMTGSQAGLEHLQSTSGLHFRKIIRIQSRRDFLPKFMTGSHETGSLVHDRINSQDNTSQEHSQLQDHALLNLLPKFMTGSRG